MLATGGVQTSLQTNEVMQTGGGHALDKSAPSQSHESGGIECYADGSHETHDVTLGTGGGGDHRISSLPGVTPVLRTHGYVREAGGSYTSVETDGADVLKPDLVAPKGSGDGANQAADVVSGESFPHRIVSLPGAGNEDQAHLASLPSRPMGGLERTFAALPDAVSTDAIGLPGAVNTVRADTGIDTDAGARDSLASNVVSPHHRTGDSFDGYTAAGDGDNLTPTPRACEPTKVEKTRKDKLKEGGERELKEEGGIEHNSTQRQVAKGTSTNMGTNTSTYQ